MKLFKAKSTQVQPKTVAGGPSGGRLGARTVVGLVGLLLLVGGPLLAPAATADSATTKTATLPTPRTGTSAVWDGTNAYIFGGFHVGFAPERQIVRYNPSTDTVTTMSATLPGGRYGASAVWDGSNAYIFGGQGDLSVTNQIVRYNPSTDTVTIMGATLPTGRALASAVWDGSNAYIFGGSESSGASNQIVRYNPSTDTVTTMSATLPAARYGTSSVWDGFGAYILGGSERPIVRYDPSTNTVTTMTATLPTTRLHTSAVWDGFNAFMFGGDDATLLGQNQIFRYNPNADALTTMSATLPTARYGTSAVWDGSNAYVFGGAAKNGLLALPLNQIVRYNLAPGAPQNLTTAPGPGVGDTTLTWQPPLGNTYSNPITNYNIYRATTTSGGEALLTQVGSVTTYTDPNCPAVCSYRITAVNAAGEGPASNAAPSPGPSLANVPLVIPSAGANQSIPGQSTQPVASQNVTTPAVTAPATCTLSPCTTPTTVPGQTVNVPGVPSQNVSTPPVPQQCVPIVICVGPIPAQPIGSTPGVPSQNVTLPSQTIPAICTALSALCLPPTTVVPSQTVSTPPVDSVPLTPAVYVSVSSTGFVGTIWPHLGELDAVGPFDFQVGPVPVTVCPQTCPVPRAPEADGSGSVTVTIQAGAQSFSQTVPVEV